MRHLLCIGTRINGQLTVTTTRRLTRGPYETTIVLDSETEGHDRWGHFIQVEPGKWAEQWPEGNYPVWREQYNADL